MNLVESMREALNEVYSIEEEKDGDKIKLSKKKEKIDLNPKIKDEMDEAKMHNCATHVEHSEWGAGACIPTQHTLVKMENGEYGVTHYDVIFESGVKEYVPVEDLQILKEVHHSGTHHYGPDAVKKFPPKKKEKKEEVEIDEMEFEAGKVYHQDTSDGKMFFKAVERQKNKRWKGLVMDIGQKKPKNGSADEKLRFWKSTPDKDIPSALKEEVEIEEHCGVCGEGGEHGIKEGTWSLPDTQKKYDELMKLMKRPIPAGKAAKVLYHLTGDDVLFDDFLDSEKKDGPKADVRPLVKDFLKKPEIKRYMKDHGVKEEVEVDGRTRGYRSALSRIQTRREKLETKKKEVTEVAPPGWEDSVKKMKKDKKIENPFALAWWMKNKGYTPSTSEQEWFQNNNSESFKIWAKHYVPEAHEIGTDEYKEYTKKVTPGQDEIIEGAGYFDIDSVDKWMKEIEKGIVAPVVNVSKSTLGGADRVSITIKLSLDPKEDWINNIFHNSRYAMFDLDRDGSFQLFSRGLKLRPNKMRKSKVKSAKDVVNKVNTWIKGIKEGVEIKEVEIEEAVSAKDYDSLKKGDTVTIEYKSAMSSGKATFKVTAKNIVGKAKVGKVTLRSVKNPKSVKHFLYKRGDNVSFAQGDMGASVVSFIKEEVEIDEKRGSDYQLYHKTFSDAMQHAYQHAEKKGFVVDPDEIDNKVATGPKKPSSGKTNRYILGTNKKKKVHIQVANLDNKKYELNMYIEDARDSVRFLKKLTQNESTQEGAPMSVVKRFLSERREKIQAVEANKALERKVRADYHKMEGDKKRMEKLATKYKIRKDEVQGIIMSEDYETEELDPVNKIAVKKKFKDRKDKDIDNDGDTDSSDKFLHKRRKAISKAIAKEEWEESPINDDRYKLSNAAPHMNIKAKSDMEGPYMYHDSLFYWSPSEQKFWSEDAGGWMEDGEAKDMMYSFMKHMWQGRKGSLPAVKR